MEAIKAVISTPSVTPAKPEFAFEMTEEAAQKNFCILNKYGRDLGRALAAQHKSPLGYGSEFRPTANLIHVFGLHPNWKRMEALLQTGSDWALDNLDMVSKSKDVEEAIQFGNHKGAEDNSELLTSLVNKDVKHGYGLVLPLKKALRIPGLLMAPMNIQKQNTID